MRRPGKLVLAAAALGGTLAAFHWLAETAPRQRAEPAPRTSRARPADPPPWEPEPPVPGFGGGYGESVGADPGDAGLAHYALGAQLLRFGDYYTAASHLATARAGLGDYGRICELLAITYDRLNMTLDLLEIMPCLEREAREQPSARALFERLSRELDVEVEFQAAASDHFVASFPSVGASAAAIGRVLDILERARRRIERQIGFASVRLVPVVVYEGRQFEAATDKPHWASGLYDGKIRVAIETYRDRPDFFETAITHEYVHALTHEYTGTRLPAWFREGLADNLARIGATDDGIRQALLDGPDPLLEIRDLSDDFTTMGEASALRAYRQSFAMVQNLVREAGWGALGDLLLDLHENPDLGFDDAFTDLYGETPADYLDRWYDGPFR